MVPANTTATVCVLATDVSVHNHGERQAGCKGPRRVKLVRQERGAVEFEVGSGTYRFASEIEP